MTLPAETVKHIENQAIALSGEFNAAQTDFPTRTLPKDMVVHSLESEMEHRNQFRAKMSTRSIEDFVAYFKLYKGTNCYISAENMIARTIFDIGTQDKPLHCKHKAALTLYETALFTALIRANNERFNQRGMAEWIEEWHDSIKACADNEEKEDIPLSKAIAAIRRLTIEEAKHSTHEQGNFKASRSQLETIEAKADEGMPGYFTFTCIPYEGLKERTFILRVNIIKSHDAPEFILKVLRFDGVKEELATEFRELLSEKLPKECETFIGSLEA